ncbi:serine/threonine protein kinase [Roseimicrobium gellanilyticum]|uniref:Serine/threonine protein kinase n=1 Tax=Roseimicrobium gellanilyticum TaxID=748857 RepID=A0A366HMS0_9BACT|nr:serine/threonine-protein kinase [Roseimicrobium gellanilyticum]RBP44458.1 serine/threonine protein kinase [Roseimicrobium gellanilyticum]
MSTSDSGPTGPESSSPKPGRNCPHCGAVLPPDAPEGQCPACLLQNLTLEPTLSPTQPAAPPKPPSPPLTPSELAPHFPQLEILECLGRGGMGVVYKARQKSLNRLVALKLLAPEREKDAAFAERFTREAQALALLSHSHIVTVYDFGITSSSQEGVGDGFYYLLMEYVDGVNLRQLLEQRKLTPEEALAIVPPLCDALEYAHERGIVHRDIKPENLLLDRRGQVKIADFGIAKMLGNGAPAHATGSAPVEPAPLPLGVTQPETALGTPAYMAPEQASAPERVDSRADIYSLGVVFYEMLTGELPAKQIEATSSRLKNLHIDVRVDEIVLRALEKKPEMRWQTAAELRTRVEQVSSATSAPPPPLPTNVSDAAPKVRPFHPWMQRFVARSFETRRVLFWWMLVAGTLLTALFMMPVSKHRVDPTPWLQMDPNNRADSKDDWQVKSEFGVPDGWWIQTMRQSTVPVTNADGKVVGRTISQASQVEREVDFFTLSYAMGVVGGSLWILFWCFFSAEQRAGDALPPAQRAFAMAMVDRTSETRILWGHHLLLFLAFVGTSVTLSGHMTAFMMLLLGDGPNPALNAFFTTFILSFVVMKGMGSEIARKSPAAPGGAPAVSAAALHARSCGPVAAAAGFVAAFVVPFLFYWLREVMSGHVRDRVLISVFLVTWGVSTVAAHWVLSRRKLSEASTRRWLRVISVCGWLVSLPMVGFAVFIYLAVAGESSFNWEPSPTEAFITPAICLGAFLLPLASWHLWRVSGPRPGVDRGARRSPRHVALGIFMLLAAVVAPLAYAASHAIEKAQDQAAFHRQKSMLQQRAILDEANLDALQQSARDLEAQLAQTSDAIAKARLQSDLERVQSAVITVQNSRQAATAELRDQLPPRLPQFMGFGLTYIVLGSSACVAGALLMFRRRGMDGGPSFILPILLVVTVGYVVFAVSQLFRTASSHSARGAVVEVPFEYNHRVRGNVLVVTLTATVRTQAVAVKTSMRGPRLSGEAHELARKSYEGEVAMPGPVPARPPHVLYRGSSTMEVAFAFPDAETARAAGSDLRPLWQMSPVPGRAASGILFQVRTKEREVYQGEMQFRLLADLEQPEAVEEAPSEPVPPKPVTQAPGALHAEELEKLRFNLAKWREERENLTHTFLPKHPKIRELENRIQATETVIDALSEKAKELHAAPASEPPVMDTSDAALRALDWKTFDQTPHQYWRQLADVRRYREAAELIERYLALHPELETEAQQVNGANLHFHAGQCYAFAPLYTQKALEHLRRSFHRPPSSSHDSQMWNCYVNATISFLVPGEDRLGMLMSYEQMARSLAFNDPNLIAVERLLGGFGKTYGKAYESGDGEDHRKLSVEYFNRAWELMDRTQWSREEAAEMRSYAHGSLAHWRQRDDCKTRNLSVGYWQLSRVYALLGEWYSAQICARLCLAASVQEPPFYLGYAYEALARAALKEGNIQRFRQHLGSAKAQAALVTDEGERKLLEKDLGQLDATASAEWGQASAPGAHSSGLAVPPGDSVAKLVTTTRTIKLTFATPHSREEIERWLKSILSGPQETFEISSDKYAYTITAAPDGMRRAIACLRALDSTEPLMRPSEGSGTHDPSYLCDSATNTGRAFIHACALRDVESMASLMDPAALGRLKDPKIGNRLTFLRPYLRLGPEELSKMRAQSPGEVPEDLSTAWNALEKEVRGDWPGKSEALEQLARQFLQHTLASFSLSSTSSDDLAVVNIAYEPPAYGIAAVCIMPEVRDREPQRGRYQVSHCIPQGNPP